MLNFSDHTDLLFDDKCICGQRNGNKISTCWVFCGNKQRNVEYFNTCQSKQRNFPNRLTTPGCTDKRKGKADPKINSNHRADCNYSVSNFVMKGPGLKLEVLSFWMNRAELIEACCKRTPNFLTGPLFILTLIFLIMGYTLSSSYKHQPGYHPVAVGREPPTHLRTTT